NQVSTSIPPRCTSSQRNEVRLVLEWRWTSFDSLPGSVEHRSQSLSRVLQEAGTARFIDTGNTFCDLGAASEVGDGAPGGSFGRGDAGNRPFGSSGDDGGGDHTMEGEMRALAELAVLRERPTAIMCSNDMTAIGVMREAYEYGMAIPKELSVVGFDDIRLSQFTIPPLTTVQMSQTLLAEFAFKALMSEVENKTPSESGREYELITS